MNFDIKNWLLCTIVFLLICIIFAICVSWGNRGPFTIKEIKYCENELKTSLNQIGENITNKYRNNGWISKGTLLKSDINITEDTLEIIFDYDIKVKRQDIKSPKTDALKKQFHSNMQREGSIKMKVDFLYGQMQKYEHDLVSHYNRRNYLIDRRRILQKEIVTCKAYRERFLMESIIYHCDSFPNKKNEYLKDTCLLLVEEYEKDTTIIKCRSLDKKIGDVINQGEDLYFQIKKIEEKLEKLKQEYLYYTHLLGENISPEKERWETRSLLINNRWDTLVNQGNYPVGEYKLSASPHASAILEHIDLFFEQEWYGFLKCLFWKRNVEIKIVGTADAIPVLGCLDYHHDIKLVEDNIVNFFTYEDGRTEDLPINMSGIHCITNPQLSFLRSADLREKIEVKVNEIGRIKNKSFEHYVFVEKYNKGARFRKIKVVVKVY